LTGKEIELVKLMETLTESHDHVFEVNVKGFNNSVDIIEKLGDIISEQEEKLMTSKVALEDAKYVLKYASQRCRGWADQSSNYWSTNTGANPKQQEQINENREVSSRLHVVVRDIKDIIAKL